MYNFCDGNLSCPSPSTGAAQQTFASALQFFATAQCLITDNWPPNARVFNNQEFNYIIVGAGTAGCVVANRLSELYDKTVLLIEAGGNPPAESIITGMFMKLVDTKYDWRFVGTTDGRPNKAYKNGIFKIPRGKMLGGCGSINGMAYFRGCSANYDAWQADGNEDWSSEIVKKYFKKIESLQNRHMLEIPAVKDSYGLNGNMVINRFNNSYVDCYNSSILDSWKELHIKKQEDLNSVNLYGCGEVTVNAADGVRWSPAKAYLVPARDRPNLKVLKNMLVTKILINNMTKTAYGVEALINNKTFTFFVKDEVIVSTGSIKTPQLLMLSGIGRKSHLEAKNIPVIVNSPNVGRNLQDHVEIPITIYGKGPRKVHVNDLKMHDAMQYLFDRTGNLAYNGSNIAAFYSHSNNVTCPEYQNHFNIYYQNDTESVLSWFSDYNNLNDTVVNHIVELNKKYTLYLFRFCPSHPLSKGNITLRSNNPKDKPIIYTNYMTDPRDIVSALKGIKMISSKITNTTYFKSIGAFLGRLTWPPCDKYVLDSDDYWKCICKYMVLPFYHPMGTARMGRDIRTSVVDSKLRVHGVKKLRVVDASVIPSIVTGNIFGPTVMIGERASDLIKESSYYNNLKTIKNSKL